MAQDGSTTEAVDAADDPGAPEAVGASDPTGTTPREPRTRSSLLPWVVAAIAVLIAVAAVVWALMAVEDARSATAEIAEVETAAGSFALELTTWDASDGMADTRETLREAGTGAFATDVDELFGGTDDLATLEEVGARSSGEVEDVLVQEIDGDRAEALAVVLQEVTTEVTDGPEISLRYARLGLEREDGTWRIASVELVVDALQQTADRTDLDQLPGGGAADGEDAG